MNDDFDEMSAFPTSEDTLFEFSARSSGATIQNATKEDLFHLIRGYKDAADVLVTHAIESRKDIRKLGNPILFLYRHHLELALKDLILDFQALLGKDEGFPKIHQIDKLWQICCGLLNDISPGMSDNGEIQQTSRLLADFQKVDPKAQAFRYPENKERTTHALGDAIYYLSTVRDVVGKISLLLDCISEHIHSLKNCDF